jgi:Asp-tRNA(Asn)/Glu-tRNA(Gln) amidotransferase A subunit family amidase
MGSDTCGSIRIPAAHNNLVGLRGTQGLSSRTGIVPLSSTQDIGGPLARSIPDLAVMLDATVGEDPADPSSAASGGHIPPSYRAALSAGALKGARIGIVRTLFGSAPEDQEVSTILQRALDEWKKAGAEMTDVVIPGLDDLLRNSSMINADFKFDLAAYLEAADHPPVRSLGEILEKGLHHSALQQTFRTRNAVERRDTDEARRARVKRVALRQAIEAVLDEHRLVALVYPTLRRKAARIGDAQAGSTCQVSAHSGLPSLAVPAGFTTDGLPIGIELLGAAWTERDLLSLGHAIEHTLRTRRPPFSTPALVGGKAPAPREMKAPVPGLPGTVVTLAYDETTSRLRYAIATGAGDAARVAAVWIHTGAVGKPGPARHRLSGPQLDPSGVVTLSAADRRALAEGSLLLRVFLTTGASPVDVPISLGR